MAARTPLNVTLCVYCLSCSLMLHCHILASQVVKQVAAYRTIHTYIHILHIHIHTYITHIHTYTYIILFTYIYIHTYITHTYIHTYIHTYSWRGGIVGAVAPGVKVGVKMTIWNGTEKIDILSQLVLSYLAKKLHFSKWHWRLTSIISVRDGWCVYSPSRR